MSKTPKEPPAQRWASQEGRILAQRIGLKSHYWHDLYHRTLTSSWGRLLLVVLVVYVLVNFLFAGLYRLGGNCVEGARPGSFFDLFFFSVQTMATIGYGKMVPITPFANVLVSIEALLGLMGFAMATGLIFAKFSKPTARVLFSQVAVVSKRDGVPCLMLRMANERGNQIVEAQIRLVLARSEQTLEGEQVRRFYELPLHRDRNVIFALTWTAIHPITPDSPLHGATLESLQQQNATVLVSFLGLDDTFSQTVHARHSYNPEEILWKKRFVDILSRTEQGQVRVDYTRFHETIPAPDVL